MVNCWDWDIRAPNQSKKVRKEEESSSPHFPPHPPRKCLGLPNAYLLRNHSVAILGAQKTCQGMWFQIRYSSVWLPCVCCNKAFCCCVYRQAAGSRVSNWYYVAIIYHSYYIKTRVSSHHLNKLFNSEKFIFKTNKHLCKKVFFSVISNTKVLRFKKLHISTSNTLKEYFLLFYLPGG